MNFLQLSYNENVSVTFLTSGGAIRKSTFIKYLKTL